MQPNNKIILAAVICGLSLNAFSCKGQNTPKKETDKTILYRGNNAEPGTLDPQVISGMWENHIVGDLFLGLLTEDMRGAAIAGAAESWQISLDGKTYTFKLRQDGKWSDGQPLTADDFVFSFRRILSPALAAKYANILYPIKNAQAYNTGKIKEAEKLGVKALDSHTLQINLEAPTPYFLTQLIHYTAYPVPKHVVEKFGKEWVKPEHIVSNGAFKLKEWKSQSYIRLVKNELFYDAANVKLKEVYFYPTEDRAAALKRFRAGELDMNGEFPAEQYQWLKTNMPKETRVSPKFGVYFYPINQRQKRFQDKRVREALNLGVDRETIVSKITTTGEMPAYNFVPPLEGYTKPQFVFKNMSKQERIDRAKKLLQEAGYTKDSPLKLTIRYNTSENHKKIAIAIAAMWKTIGVEADFLNAEAAIHYKEMEEGNFDIARAGWIGDYPDAQTFLMLLQYPNKLNYGAYQSQKYNDLMQKAGITLDTQKRIDIMQEAEQTALDDYATIPIYHYIAKNLVATYIKGWQPNAKDIHRSRWIYKE